MQHLISALTTHPRQEPELIIIAQYLIQHFSFIRDLQAKLTPENFNKIFMELALERYQENQSIFEAGEVGRKMYFLLQGEVAILIPKNENSKKLPFKTTKVKDTIEHIYSDFKLAAILCKGSHFGEIALQNKVPRTASVLAQTSIIVATLSYRNYQNIIRGTLTQYQRETMNFLDRLPIFYNWKREGLSILLRYLSQETFNPFTHIYRHQDESSYIYLIKSGVIQIEITDTVEESRRKKILCAFQLSDNQHFGEYEALMQSDLKGRSITSSKNIISQRTSTALTLTKCTLFKIPLHQFLDTYSIYSDFDLLKQRYKQISIQREMMHIDKNTVLNTQPVKHNPIAHKRSLAKLKLRQRISIDEHTILNPEPPLAAKIKAGLLDPITYSANQNNYPKFSKLLRIASKININRTSSVQNLSTSIVDSSDCGQINKSSQLALSDLATFIKTEVSRKNVSDLPYLKQERSPQKLNNSLSAIQIKSKLGPFKNQCQYFDYSSFSTLLLKQ